jgi:hypothetical protein
MNRAHALRQVAPVAALALVAFLGAPRHGWAQG